MLCAKISNNCVQFHQNRRELQYSVPQKPQYRQACYAVQRLHLPTVTAHHLQYKASLMTTSKHNNIQQTYITTTYQPQHRSFVNKLEGHITQVIHKQAVAPRSGPLQFDFVKDWTTRYAACAINSNTVNSTGLGYSLRPALAAAS